MGPADLLAWLIWSSAGVLGLVVGSFLNVVILRLPAMLHACWRLDAAEILDQPAPETPGIRFDLVSPSSRCPNCEVPIKPWHNLPVLGYLLLHGRCAACRNRISIQYPVVEIAAALLGIIAFARFGVSAWGVCLATVSWALLALAAIDFRTQLLPDAITLPLLWAGLLTSLFHLSPSAPAPTAAILGAVSGYGGLWLIFQCFRLATGKIGMGHGDFKLTAALGAWLGWTQLPLALLIASLSGLLVGGLLMVTGRAARSTPLPFGPWLALGGWLTLVAGDTILHAYLTLSGLR